MQCEFKIGDLVRLKNGWTPMIVLAFEDRGGIMIAKYANSSYNPVTQQDFDNPKGASSTIRRHSTGFVAWDGDRYKGKRVHPMPRKYITLTGSNLIGTFLSETSIGQIALEMDGGQINTYNPEDLALYYPFTFSVKALGSNYRCNYTWPEGICTPMANDLLLSKSGNLYVVMEVDTKCTNPKGLFEGSRIETTPLI